MDIKPVGLPVHDSVVAELAAKLTVDVQPTQPSELTPTPEVKLALAVNAIGNFVSEKKLLIPSEFSFQVQPYIETINNAVLDGERTIAGQLYIDYAKELTRAGYIPAHEVVKFLDRVRAL